MSKYFKFFCFIFCFITVFSSFAMAWESGDSIYRVMFNLYDNKYITYEGKVLEVKNDIIKVQWMKQGRLGDISYEQLPLDSSYFSTWKQSHDYVQARYREKFEQKKSD